MTIAAFQKKLLEAGKQMGFKEIELYYEKSTTFSCHVYAGEVDEYEIAEDSGISFRGMFNGKFGYAYAEKLDDDSIFFILENAKENALSIEEEDMEDIFAGSPSYKEGTFFSEELKNVTTHEKINLLLQIEKLVRNYDPRIVGTNYCMLKTVENERALKNSKGLSLHERQNYLLLYLSVIAKDHQELKMGTTIKLTKQIDSLDPHEIAKEAAEEALSYLGEQSIKSQAYKVLFRHDAAASLLQTFVPIFSAENVQSGKSFLKEKTGTKIAGKNITFIDDPFLENGLGSRSFDSEGVAAKKHIIIHNGTLKTLLHNRKTAKKDGVETTGHAYKSSYKGTLTVAPSNFYMKPGEKGYEELVHSIDEGILVTQLAGLHSGANPISGDFSVAANGFYIKNGKIKTPLKQMTIAGNFYELLKNMEQVGADLTFPLGKIGSPSIIVHKLPVTIE